MSSNNVPSTVGIKTSSPGETGASCGACHNLDHSRMVQCDDCDTWFHYECVNVTDSIQHKDWSCMQCLNTSSGAQQKPQSSNEWQFPSQQQRDSERQKQQEQQRMQQTAQQQNLGIMPNLQTIGYVGSETGATSTPLSEQRGFIQEVVMKSVNEDQQTLSEKVERSNRELREQLTRMQQAFADERKRHSQQLSNLMQCYEGKAQARQGNAGAIKRNNNASAGAVATGTKHNVLRLNVTKDRDIEGTSRASSKASVKIREFQRKALEERQALEKKQLEERLALELECAKDSAEESEGEESGNMSKIADWLSVNDFIGNPPQANETLLPGYSSRIPQIKTPSVPGHSDVNNKPLDSRNLAARHTVKDLPRFGGNPEEWPRFIAAYDRTTRLCAFSNDELLDRLERSLYDRAFNAVRCLLLHPENVPVIIQRLRTLFGNPESIIDTLISQIKMMPTLKVEKLETIIDFGVAVQNLCATIQACQMDECLFNVALHSGAT